MVDIPVFKIDTAETKLIRVAAALKTVPKYIWPKNLKFVDSQVFALNLIDVVKNLTLQKEPFLTFRNQYSDFLPDKELVKLWIGFFQFGQVVDQATINAIKLSMLPQFVPSILKIDEYNDIWKTRDSFLRTVQNDIDKNNNISNQTITNYQKLDSKPKIFSIISTQPMTEEKEDSNLELDDTRVYTEFRLNQVVFRMKLNLPDLSSLLELFNELTTSAFIPFANCQEYYKILKEFIPSTDWKIQTENLTIKVCQTNMISDDYTTVVISPDFVAQISLNLEITMSKEKFIHRLLSAFPFATIPHSETVESVSGIFFFPDTRIDVYAFSDLVMNDSFFSNILSIDESTAVTKKKSEYGQPWLHVHFDHPSTGHLTASIVQGIVDSNEQEIKRENVEYDGILKMGEPYLRVNVHADNEENIKRFQNIFASLINIFLEKQDQVLAEYRDILGPDFGQIQTKSAKIKSTHIPPELNLPNYTRFCPPNRQPTVINEDEVKVALKSKSVLKFPRDKPTEGITYPSDGINQRYFICNHDEYPYPSVQENKQTSSQQYPFLPCCFKTDQSNSSNYNMYYFNKSSEKIEKKQQEMIKTGKIVGGTQFANLSKTVNQFFNNVQSLLDPSYLFLRVGSEITSSSFLEAVMNGLNEQTNIFNWSRNGFEQKLFSTRKEIAQRNDVIATSRQSNFDLSLEDIQKMLNNQNTYLNPKLFSQMLEEYFDCNIFLFNPSGMFSPRFTQGYYRWPRKNKKCIFIYEHTGSESNSNLLFPQCELIFRWKEGTTDDINYSFDWTEPISQLAIKTFEQIIQSYSLSRLISSTVFPLSLKDAEGQIIDDFGKTRGIKFGSIYVLTDPLPPLKLPEIKDIPIPVNYDRARAFLDQHKATKITITSKLTGLNAILGNVKITIPIEPEKNTNLPFSKGHYYIQDKKSFMNMYHRNKKLARYLTEYTFWIFSKFLLENKIETIDDDILKTFREEKIIIKKINYSTILKKFTMNCSFLENGKLVISDETTKQRLIYLVKLMTIQDLPTLRDYHKRTVIHHYYVDISDFRQTNNQVILRGIESLEKWIHQDEFDLKLNHSLLIGQTKPYFLFFMNKVWLVQNANNFTEALTISVNWAKYKINQAAQVENINDYSYRLYNFYNSNSKLVEKTEKLNVNVLVYLTNNEKKYSALLEVN